MSESLTVSAVVDHILLRGTFSAADLDVIQNAIKDRRQVLNQAKKAQFRPGQTVRFNATASPKYLVGHTAEIVRINQKKVVLKMPQNYALRKFSGLGQVTCPVGIIDPIEDGGYSID